jgi:hypothetical protein
VQAAAAYDLGKRWRAGTRVMLLSGVPTETLTDDGPRFGGRRADPFLRVDLRVEKRWVLGEHAWWSVMAEVLNATLAKEVTGRRCDEESCSESVVGPVTIPSIGVAAAF